MIAAHSAQNPLEYTNKNGIDANNCQLVQFPCIQNGVIPVRGITDGASNVLCATEHWIRLCTAMDPIKIYTAEV